MVKTFEKWLRESSFLSKCQTSTLQIYLTMGLTSYVIHQEWLVFLKGFFHWVKRHTISTLVWISCSHSLVCFILIVIIFRICFRISLNCWNKKQFSILYGMLIKMFLLLAYYYHIFSEQLHRYSYLFYPEPFHYKLWEIPGNLGHISIPGNFVKQNYVKALKSNF